MLDISHARLAHITDGLQFPWLHALSCCAGGSRIVVVLFELLAAGRAVPIAAALNWHPNLVDGVRKKRHMHRLARRDIQEQLQSAQALNKR